MAEVKWIKLNVGMFDGNSFKRIKKAKIGGESYRDKLTAIWFELLDFAGRCNASGMLVESQEIPYASLEDIALLIDRDIEELELCMQFYIKNRMITIIDDVYMLTNWSKYQSTDKLAELREYNRLAQQKSRAKKKLLLDVNDKSMTSQECQDTDTDIDIEEDKEKDKNKIKKHKYGEYNNVLLSDEDLSKLKTEYSDYEERIEKLSIYMASTGKKYKNHLATIRNWARKETVEKPKTQSSYVDAINNRMSVVDDWLKGE